MEGSKCNTIKKGQWSRRELVGLRSVPGTSVERCSLVAQKFFPFVLPTLVNKAQTLALSKVTSLLNSLLYLG